jgi:hypothetical protein
VRTNRHWAKIRPKELAHGGNSRQKGSAMTWRGTWRNQYGSILEITDDSDGKIAGTFRMALEDSGFFGREIAIVGVHHGDCIGLAGGGKTPAGDMVVTYTGLLREDRMETLWYVVADAALGATAEGAPATLKKLHWWRAVTTSSDSFERVPEPKAGSVTKFDVMAAGRRSKAPGANQSRA